MKCLDWDLLDYIHWNRTDVFYPDKAAGYLRCSERTVRRCIARLQKRSLIQITYIPYENKLRKKIEITDTGKTVLKGNPYEL